MIVLQRLTKILRLYDLSWRDVDIIKKEGDWETEVNKAIDADIGRLLAAKAAHYQLPILHPYDDRGQPKNPSFSIRQKMPLYLQTMGDLPRAALRARYFRLRYVLGGSTTTRGQCRLCQKGDENVAHLLECPALPEGWIIRRETLYRAIAEQAGHTRVPTRRSLPLVHKWMATLQWPKAHKILIKRVTAFLRCLINMYAALAPPAWEPPSTRQIAVRRVRTARVMVRVARR